MPSMEQLLLNLARPRFRKTTHNGEEYIVVPLRMIVPGVLPGSQGPLYYPPEEIAHNYQQWDGIPVTLYHPTTENGQGLSAKSPGVLQKQGIGIIKNPRVDNKGLRAEAWLNVSKTKRLDPSILANVYAGRPVEISTGLYTDNHRANNGANYRGRGYTHIARNYRADHLAILPGQKGACSLDDGCGLLQNVEATTLGSGLVDNQWVTTSQGNKLFIEDGEAKIESLGKGLGKFADKAIQSVKSLHSEAKGKSLWSKFKRLIGGKHGLGFNQMSKEFSTLGQGLASNCGGEGGTMGPCPGSGQGKEGSGAKFKSGDKVSIGGGIYQGKKAKVLEHNDEGVLVKFPDRKERNGSVSKGATILIPHSTDKPTMTTSKHLTKNTEKDQTTGQFLPLGAGNGKGEPHDAAKRGAKTLYDSVMMEDDPEVGDIDDADTEDAGFTAEDDGETMQNSECGCGGTCEECKSNGRSGQSTVRNKESQTMALTQEDREVIIGNLCTNCSCEQANVFNEEDRELLENMSDGKLIALAEQRDTLAANQLVINQIRKKFKVSDRITLNALPGVLAQQQGGKVPAQQRPEEASGEEADPDAAEEDTEEKGTVKPRGSEEAAMNRRLRLSAEDRATLNWAKEERDRQKQLLIESLTANMSCDEDEAEETLNELNDMSLEQLQKISRLAPRRPTRNAAPSPQAGYGGGFVGFAPPVAPQRRANYAGAGVLQNRNRMTENSSQEDVLDIPTLNAAELSPLYNKKNGGN